MNQHLRDYAAAIEYLSRDPHANRELLIALRYEPLGVIRVARRGDRIVGAFVRGPGPLAPQPHWLRLDADDQEAVATLLAQNDIDDRTVLSLHRPWIGEFVVRHYGVVPTGEGVYGYLVDRDRLVRGPTSQSGC